MMNTLKKKAYLNPGTEVQEVFTYTATEKKPSGEFTCPDSQITAETVYSIQYPVSTPDWSVQTGVVGELPDYLIATDVKGTVSASSLKRIVNFLHIISPDTGTTSRTSSSRPLPRLFRQPASLGGFPLTQKE